MICVHDLDGGAPTAMPIIAVPMTLAQRPLLRLEEHLSRNLTDALWLSADAFYNLGGETSIDGIDQDNMANTLRIGAVMGLRLWRGADMGLNYEIGGLRPWVAPEPRLARVQAGATGSRWLRSLQTSRQPGDGSNPAPPQPERECEGPSKAVSACPPASLPADSLNHQKADSGIPLDSIRSATALALYSQDAVCKSAVEVDPSFLGQF